MKTKFFLYGFIIATLCAAICSCSKGESILESDGPAKKEMIPVSFSVNFSKEVTDFFRSGEEVKIMDFFFLAYDVNSGECVKRTRLIEEDFTGAVTDLLPEGNYMFVFYGCNEVNWISPLDPGTGNMYSETRRENLSFQLSESVNNQFLNANRDVFYKKIYCLIEKDKSNDITVYLDRIVGKIEVVFQDIIPNEVDEITVEYFGFPLKWYYYASEEFVTVKTQKQTIDITADDKNAAGYSFFINTFDSNNADLSKYPYPVSIVITAKKKLPPGVLDTGQSIVATREINNVEVLQNKTIRYSGEFFITQIVEGTSASFPVLFNGTWGETIEKEL